MEKRQHAHEPLVPFAELLQPGAALDGVRHKIPMRQRHAFRHTGRTAGILQDGDIIRGRRRNRHMAARASDKFLEVVNGRRSFHRLDRPTCFQRIQQPLQPGQVVLDSGQNHPLQRAAGHGVSDPGIKLFQRDDGFRSRVSHLVSDFTAHIERIDGDDIGSRL